LAINGAFINDCFTEHFTLETNSLLLLSDYQPMLTLSSFYSKVRIDP